MSRGFWRFVTFVGALGLMGFLAWEGWQQLGPRRPGLSEARRELAAALIPEVVEALRESRAGVRSAVFIHLVNDPTDHVTDLLAEELERSGVLHLNDRPVGEKLQRMLRLPVTATADAAAALEVARRRGAQAVLFGTVHTFESVRSGARLDLELTLAELGRGAVLFNRHFVRDTRPAATAAGAVEVITGGGNDPRRLLTWVAAVLLLPVFTVGFIRAMVRRESNRVNALTLGLYTVVDLLLLYVLGGIAPVSGMAALVFVLLGAGALAYNVFLMTFALQLET